MQCLNEHFLAYVYSEILIVIDRALIILKDKIMCYFFFCFSVVLQCSPFWQTDVVKRLLIEAVSSKLYA